MHPEVKLLRPKSVVFAISDFLWLLLKRILDWLH